MSPYWSVSPVVIVVWYFATKGVVWWHSDSRRIAVGIRTLVITLPRATNFSAFHFLCISVLSSSCYLYMAWKKIKWKRFFFQQWFIQDIIKRLFSFHPNLSSCWVLSCEEVMERPVGTVWRIFSSCFIHRRQGEWAWAYHACHDASLSGEPVY